MASRDRPSFVRGVEFEAIPRTGDRYELSHKKRLTIGGINADKEGKATVLDSGLDYVSMLCLCVEKAEKTIQKKSRRLDI